MFVSWYPLRRCLSCRQQRRYLLRQVVPLCPCFEHERRETKVFREHRHQITRITLAHHDAPVARNQVFRMIEEQGRVLPPDQGDRVHFLASTQSQSGQRQSPMAFGQP